LACYTRFSKRFIKAFDRYIRATEDFGEVSDICRDEEIVVIVVFIEIGKRFKHN